MIFCQIFSTFGGDPLVEATAGHVIPLYFDHGELWDVYAVVYPVIIDPLGLRWGQFWLLITAYNDVYCICRTIEQMPYTFTLPTILCIV